ncbi:hypothetical protein Xvie_00823 [Xenorhabdus vietnamensis]|uniref:Single-stranded DNA-binding protein n=1 Tax=Xenorhabdus vietnamensis TaxID=351656 RepID=A0A1Y2SHS2_9GAMM|nr:hypothetical protein [Xenorhabdus vietnamensis]OTA17439.1 hypothetical protein Xvie_00823 [Xenorhabdus vietnamensis]
MNIKEKSALANTSKSDVYYNVKILRLQIFSREDRSSGVKVTVHHEDYNYLFYELAHPDQEIGGIATYAGLLESLLKGHKVKIKATGYHGDQVVGYISGIVVDKNNF